MFYWFEEVKFSVFVGVKMVKCAALQIQNLCPQVCEAFDLEIFYLR